MFPLLFVAATLVTLPAPFQRVVARVDSPLKTLCKGQMYEGNNLDMRGASGPDEMYARTGDEAFAAWKEIADASGGIFVLRDSLISQQDHPYRQDKPRALLLPPNWITAAALGAAAAPGFKGPLALKPDDDAAWTLVKSAKDLFGSFPPSDSVFGFATKPLVTASPTEKRRIANARATVLAMGELAAPLLVAQAKGLENVIEVGASVLAASDERYFGKELRAEKIIPISVENPRPVELAEGKGFEPSPDVEIPAAVRVGLIRAVYGARLRAGDLALERYDLSSANQRLRAIDVAKAALSGAPNSSHRLWLWVTGKLDDSGELRGEDAVAYVPEFRQQLKSAGLDMKRIRLLSKPVRTPPKGADRKRWLQDELARFEALDLPLSTLYGCEQLLALSGKNGPYGQN